MIDPEKVKMLLGNGLTPSIVATTMGCDHSYIHQLLADEEFSSAVTELRLKNLTATNKRDTSIGEIEDTLVEKLREAVDSGMIFKPREILSAFSIVNKAIRRGIPASESVVVNNTIVNLHLPPAATQHFTKTIQGEVVEVDGQTMVTMPARQLLRNLSQQAKQQEVKGVIDYDKVANYIPS